MFCHEEANTVSLPCSLKWIYEITSFISLIVSLILVSITIIKIKMNLIHKLVLQIIISEIIDEINILLGIISDSFGKLSFENYDSRMYVCNTQMFLSTFSCLWTLTASLFISLKLYDLIINKNRIFNENKFTNKHATFISISVPLIVSYILWTTHIIRREPAYALDLMYKNKIQMKVQKIRLVFCWISEEVSIALACIVGLLIFGNLYFSIFRGFFFLKKMKDKIITQDDDENLKENKKLKNINQIQGILFLYPLISCIIWIIFFLFIFLFYFSYRDIYCDKTTNTDCEKPNDVIPIVFCVFMAFRQIIYILVYFFSQKNLRKYTLSCLKCKICRRNKYSSVI